MIIEISKNRLRELVTIYCSLDREAEAQNSI